MQGALIFLGLAALVACDPVGLCPPADPEDFHMPDDKDCSVFYKCAHGVPVKFDCPAPLHFNARISVCDWPQDAGCTAGSGPTTVSSPGTTEPPTCSCTCPTAPNTTPTGPNTTPTGPNTTPTGPNTTPTGPNTTPTPSSTTPTAPTTSAGVCDAIGTCPYPEDENSVLVLLPHRSKCDVFCRCVHGVPREEPCAPGTWFNAAQQVCDWPANSGCVPGSGPTSAPGTTKPTTAAPSSTTAAPSRPRCDAVGTCPIYDQDSIVKLLPHRTRCDVYCRCDHGEPIEMPCGPGTWFNAALEICDHPQDSGCTPSSG